MENSVPDETEDKFNNEQNKLKRACQCTTIFVTSLFSIRGDIVMLLTILNVQTLQNIPFYFPISDISLSATSFTPTSGFKLFDQTM